MSEFRRQWPTTPDLADHTAHLQSGLEVINNRLLLPEDGRWDISYGVLAMGGTVLAEGQPGAGKTAFGNIVFGEDNRVDIASTDTAETLEGYESPVDHKFVDPKLVLDPEDLRLFLNEISHLRDTGPLHKYWDGETLKVNGVTYDLANASIYSTANFPDGHRSKKIDLALRSRQDMSTLAGDNGEQIAAQLHGMNSTSSIDPAYSDGILPPARVRGAMRGAMEQSAPMNAKSGNYVANVLKGINDNPLLRNVDLTDRRTSQGWAQTVRALRLVDAESILGGPIRPEELARVAGLALGSIATLSSTGAEKLNGSNERMPDLDRAVLARRLVAGIAMREFVKTDAIRKAKTDMDEAVADGVRDYSYAALTDNARTDEIIVDSIVSGSKQEGASDVQTRTRGRWALRKRS